MSRAKTRPAGTPPAERACGSCVFYRPLTEGADAGECRRYPRVPLASIAGHVSYVYPTHAAGDGCGEYRAKTT